MNAQNPYVAVLDIRYTKDHAERLQQRADEISASLFERGRYGNLVLAEYLSDSPDKIADFASRMVQAVHRHGDCGRIAHEFSSWVECLFEPMILDLATREIAAEDGHE